MPDAKINVVKTRQIILLVATVLSLSFALTSSLIRDRDNIKDIPKMKRELREYSIGAYCSRKMIVAIAKAVMTPEEYKTLMEEISAEETALSKLYSENGNGKK